MDYTKGNIRFLFLEANKQIGPASGKRWLILYGKFNHITGTDSYATIQDKMSKKDLTTALVPAAHPNAGIPLFYNGTYDDGVRIIGVPNTDVRGIWLVNDELELDFQGGANSGLSLVVFEF